MKILLAGEYSRLHNSLKEGLQKLGHEAYVLSAGDDFKNYPSDYSIRPELTTRFPLSPLRKLIYRFTRHDIAVNEKIRKLDRIIPRLQNFDVVQLINSFPFETTPRHEKNFLNRLFRQNHKAFLLACGDDPVVNDFYLRGKMRYSVLTPLSENPFLKDQYGYSLKYLRPEYRQLHDFVLQNVKAVIPVDLDYALPYEGHPLNAGMIPNPVNIDKIPYIFTPPHDRVVIFHGINSGNIHKKGNIHFSNALKLIRKKYGNRVHIVETRDLPYREYMQQLRQAHIVLDQVYSYDQGYNALESMAMGNVVFTGAEKEFREYYDLQDEVCINALPDPEYLTERLSELIENPAKLEHISRNARHFIEQHHHYVKIAERYIEVWQSR